MRWCGGAVVRWCGGAVVRWCGGAGGLKDLSYPQQIMYRQRGNLSESLNQLKYRKIF